MPSENDPDRFYETLTLNAQRGDAYAIRFRDDPTVYRGIPVMDLSASERDIFAFRILAPENSRGMVQKRVGDIVEMEPA